MFGLGAGPVRSDGSVAFAGHGISSLLSCRRALGILPRRGTGLPLRAAWILRVGSDGRRRASGRRRSAASKANTLSPLITVVVSVCHSYRLVSCITCPSYKKDVQQMGLRVKSSVNGTKGATHRASKHLSMRPMSVRPSGGRQQWTANRAVRPKNGATHMRVRPSVEPWAAMLRQGRIVKPRNKSARSDRPRKG